MIGLVLEASRRLTDSRFGRISVRAIPLLIGAVLIYWLSNARFDAGRGDLFYLADAFLRGRADIPVRLGPYDVILLDGRIYVPFPPFPAIVLMPLVALVGPVLADQWESGINALLAGAVVGLGWWVAGLLGVRRPRDRYALFLLLGFSTPIWWVTTRGGVWHTGQLIATILTLLVLAELWGRQRALLLGLLLGAAFLTRPPLAFAAPALALWYLVVPSRGPWRPAELRNLPWRAWVLLIAGFAPPLLFFFGYNAVRFGSPLESGYGLATLPAWLEELRANGLFSVVHVPMNLGYLLLKLPQPIDGFPFFRPDGLGMSVFLTSPGLLLAGRAPWRDRRACVLLVGAVLVLIPTLLYYGGGWLQYGYRYFLDSIPFVWALVALAVARDGCVGRLGWLLIGLGLVVNLLGVYWAYNL